MTKQVKSTDDNKPEYLRITGKSMYARVFEPAPERETDKFTVPAQWTIDVLVDKVTKAQLEMKGVRVRSGNPKYDAIVEENGLSSFDGSYVSVQKKTVRKVYDKDKGKVLRDPDTGEDRVEAAARPPVEDSKGREIPESADLKIGNLSDVEVTLQVVRGAKPKGEYSARLIRTKILNLVEYIPQAGSGSFVFGSEGERDTDALSEDDMPFAGE